MTGRSFHMKGQHQNRTHISWVKGACFDDYTIEKQNKIQHYTRFTIVYILYCFRYGEKYTESTRVLARILDLGRVSNDQGVHMPITLNSQITVLVMLANKQCLWLFYVLQPNTIRAYTLILRTDIKILSYFSNSWGV